MKPLTPAQRATLGSVVDAFFPALPGPSRFWTSSATEWGVLPRIEAFIAGMDPAERRTLLQGLELVGSRAAGVLFAGRPSKLVDISLERRVELLEKMAASPLKPARQLYATLKQLTMVVLTTPGAATLDGDAPAWSAMGFHNRGQDPDEVAPSEAPPLKLRLTAPAAGGAGLAQLTCDVVIVGSGAGGGVAAAVLAAAGHDVVILDKGRLYQPTDFRWQGTPEKRDTPLVVSATTDQGLQIYQGSCVGGGTVVNYTTSLPLPERTRYEWDAQTGFAGHFTGAGFSTALQAAQSGYGVNLDNSQPEGRDRILERGLERLGWDCQAIPRNAKSCQGACGWCGFGCRRGAKQSTPRTWLARAVQDGARLVAGASVRRIIMRNNVAAGVDAELTSADGTTTRLRVNARAVVAAAGAIESPALLRRSGMTSRAVGRYLRLHPVSLVFGRFPAESVDPWRGPMQARLSEEHADLDGADYGVRLETAPLHPLVFAGYAPWTGPHAFKTMLSEFRQWSFIAVLLKERDSGDVGIDGRGEASVRYSLSARDRGHLMQGQRRAAEVLAAAGAETVLAGTHVPVRWKPNVEASPAAFGARLAQVGVGPTRMPLLSFHQMGTLRMGSDPATSVTDQWGGVHGTKGLYVMDASVFPTASGVNPMLTISTLAYQAAGALAERL